MVWAVVGEKVICVGTGTFVGGLQVVLGGHLGSNCLASSWPHW